MATDGKTIRLRASCNACNESKVRCSQSKPTCARCERNGIDCIYGLSRRTHKDAPPISMPPSSSQRPRGPSRSSSSGDMNANSSSGGGSRSHWRGLSFSKSPAATPSTSNSNTSPDRSSGAHDANLFGDYMSPAGSQFMIPPQQQQQQQNNNAAATPQFHMYTHGADPTAADLRHPAGLSLLDFSSLDAVTGTSSPLDDPLSAVVTRFPTPGAEYINSSNSASAADMATFWEQQMAMSAAGAPATTASSSSSPPSPPPPPPPPQQQQHHHHQYHHAGRRCSCHAGVMELLASTRGGGDSGAPPLPPDAQLARLKRCIAACEASMGCAHGGEDAAAAAAAASEPVHIMAVATLIGYVVNEFEVLAGEALLRGSAAAAGGEKVVVGAAAERMEGGMPPDERGVVASGSINSNGNSNMSSSPKARLSWGVLELEDDDEVDLRQRLYLLSFRRLERLLSRLTQYLRGLHDARAGLPDPSRHFAFVMACDYTRLWLERKAEDVKALFSIPLLAGDGDEAVGPALAHMEM